MKNYRVKDMSLAEPGRKRIEWARRRMPVLGMIRERYEESKPLAGNRVTACLHVTVETANLILTLQAGGADVALAGSNPLSTQDDVAAALAEESIQVYAFKGQNETEYYECLEGALAIGPNIVLDDGADTVATIHEQHADLIDDIRGGCEETTTGVLRLRAMASQRALKFPIIAVNDAETKRMFDNRYGTGQSTLHGIMNATNFLFAGKTVVVAGYGWCGRGIAMRAKGLGADVIVVEVIPRKALEAAMDGYRVMPMKQAAKHGDLFITATGDIAAIRKEHLQVMKDEAILANAGHFNVEIQIPDLEELATDIRALSEDVVEYILEDGRKVYLLAEGRLVNLASAYGHPPEVMDMSFANQALSVRYIVEHASGLENQIYPVPTDIDHSVAELKLESLGIEIERLTEEQQEYLRSWALGT
ncbi:MAG: adenosylhomocysteinase [Candidatus Bipolaricaulia bacterium]